MLDQAKSGDPAQWRSRMESYLTLVSSIGGAKLGGVVSNAYGCVE